MISACKHGCSPLISEQPRADWQLQYLRSWRYLKNWMGNIFQSAEFILELRSSASPNYEQDIRDNTQRIWHTRPLIGQSLTLWLADIGDIIIRGSDPDHLTGCFVILTRDWNTSDPNIKIEISTVTTLEGGQVTTAGPACLRSHHTHFGNKTRIKVMPCCCLCLPKGKKLAVNS